MTAWGRWRAVPYPGLGLAVELYGGHAGGVVDVVGAGEALAGDGVSAEYSPPALVQVEPAGADRDEDGRMRGWVSSHWRVETLWWLDRMSVMT